MRDEARMRVPVDTGRVTNSIDYDIEETPKGYVGKVFSNKEHAIYVELGTGPKGEANHNGISPQIKPIYSPSGWVYYDEDKQKFIFTKRTTCKTFYVSSTSR